MAQLVTDAVVSKPQAISYRNSCLNELNINILKLIEHELDIEEKFSILFLMLDNFYCFSSLIDIYLKNDCKNIISKYLRQISNWKKKLIEALCIINHAKIIASLGLSMKSLEINHCPLSPRIVSNINVGAKILYKFLDSLSAGDQKLLLNAVYKDIGKDKRLNDVDVLELHVLYWISMGYITIKPVRGDMRQLQKCLKSLGHYDKPYYCDIEWYCSEKLINTKSPDDKNSIGQHVIIKKGLCLIINEVDYRSFKTEYDNRIGSNKDKENLIRTFRGLNFEVHDYTDLGAVQIIEKINNFASKKDAVYECFAVCILSHGITEKIVAVDNGTIFIHKIEELMCTKVMENTLKLLIIQACQGDTIGVHSNADDHLTTDGNSYNSNISFYKEFCSFSSTIKNHVAYRHKQEGSWFITDLCNVLKENTKDNISIDDWKREVINRVLQRRGKLSHYSCAQLPQATDRMTKKFSFLPFTGV